MVFFLFIALCLMQNPIGWCCGWLEITELAQGFSDRHGIKCLARDILHQVQGVFSVFVFHIWYKPRETRYIDSHSGTTWVVTLSYEGGKRKGKGIVLGNQWRGENEAAYTKLEETIDRRGEKSMKYSTLNSCTFQNKFVTLQPVRCSVRLRFS